MGVSGREVYNTLYGGALLLHVLGFSKNDRFDVLKTVKTHSFYS